MHSSDSVVIEQLRAVISNRPPVAIGVLPVRKEACSLFYKHDGDVRFLDFSSSTPEDLATLSAACQAATFGIHNQNVLDETYRKAVKMDKEHFACKLEEEVPRMLDAVRPVLFTDGEEKTNIRAELYKLNVYDEGAFFKSHKDTPRGKTMFGSLVIAYPTPHAGGTLRFSKGGKTWDLDSAALLAQQQEPSLAYAVFFSDTDHEVLPVTSGHRVTITYNLHIAPELGENDSGLSVKTEIPIQLKDDETTIASTIQHLLDSPAFMPKGGFMGFGLQYQYSVSDRVSGSFDDIFTRLKGVDAAVVGACKQLGLKTKGKALSKSNSGLYWLLDEIPSVEGYYGDNSSLDDEFQNGILVGGTDGQRGMGDRFVWITEVNRNARSSTQAFAGYYGNSPSAEEFYADLCFVAHIGRPGSRDQAAKLPRFEENDDGEYQMVESD